MNLKKSELKILSNKIEELVNKSKEEISILKNNIKNLNPLKQTYTSIKIKVIIPPINPIKPVVCSKAKPLSK